jgi:hypothetical protein
MGGKVASSLMGTTHPVVPAKAGTHLDLRPKSKIDPGLRRDDGNDRYTLRVATAGGTREARSAGPSTASWPRNQRHTNPTGT